MPHPAAIPKKRDSSKQSEEVTKCQRHADPSWRVLHSEGLTIKEALDIYALDARKPM
jgi:hypothetical protein